MWKLRAHIPIEFIEVGEWVEFGNTYFIVTCRTEKGNKISLQLGKNLMVQYTPTADISRAHKVL